MREARSDRHTPVVGELDGIPHEVEQHLSHATTIAHHPARTRRVDLDRQRQSHDVRRRGDRLAHLLEERHQVERLGVDVQLAGLDLGEVEHVVDDPQQRLARSLQHAHAGGLLLGERRVQEELRHAEHAVHRRAQLVTHRGEELALGARRLLGPIARDRQLLGVRLQLRACRLQIAHVLVQAAIRLDAIGNVAHHAAVERAVVEADVGDDDLDKESLPRNTLTRGLESPSEHRPHAILRRVARQLTLFERWEEGGDALPHEPVVANAEHLFGGRIRRLDRARIRRT